MTSIRVLWVSSRIFNDSDEKQSGVWQKALAEKLQASNLVVLGNVSVQSTSRSITRYNFKGIEQWGLPVKGKIRKGMPPIETSRQYSQVVEAFNPQLIQVWGSENPLKLLPFLADHNVPVMLTVQGVLGSIGNTLLRGLSVKEIISTIGLREILFGSSLFAIKRSFEKEAVIENQILKSARFIETQSEWTISQIKAINPVARYLKTQRALRPEFLTAKKWIMFKHSNPIIYTASWGYSLKGLHVLIKALAVVKISCPNIQLRIAGAKGRADCLGDGYLRLIIKMINSLGLEHNVIWLGSIDANQIIIELQHASVFVSTSFVESYSVALAEAMCIGTPSVVSYAGAMPELADPGIDALFFTPGDDKQCAFQILKFLNNVDFACSISENALAKSIKRESEADLVRIQHDNYVNILNNIN